MEQQKQMGGDLASTLSGPHTDTQDGGARKWLFPETYCSQCGEEFGPGEHGFSDCRDHATPDLIREHQEREWRLRQERTKAYTRTHVRPRHLLSAWTPEKYDGLYPPYVNITQVGTMIQVTVRAAVKPDGSEGASAMVEVNRANYANIFEGARAHLVDQPEWVRATEPEHSAGPQDSTVSK